LRVHTIRRLGQQSRGQQSIRESARVVSAAELEELGDRSVLVTTEFTFEHLTFETFNHLLCPYFCEGDTQCWRGIEHMNSVIATGYAREVRGFLLLARRLDAEIGRQRNHVIRTDLAARVGALEKRVARLLERHDEPQAEVDH
jgi:hypothetical protein